MHHPERHVAAAMDWEADLQPYIFTCTVCSRPVHDVYNDDPELTGLSDDADSPDTQGQHEKSEPVTFDSLRSKRVAAKAWFFPDCAHLFCSGHLPGGGVPFYPSGSNPKSECPICSVDEPKDLFPLYSSRIGELDPRIPRKYFDKADIAHFHEAGPGCDVIKFQFENLLRFAGHMLHEMNAMKSTFIAKEKSTGGDEHSGGNSTHQEILAKPSISSCSTTSNRQNVTVTSDGACPDALSSIISPSPSQLIDVDEQKSIESQRPGTSASPEKPFSWQPFSRPCLRNRPSAAKSPSLHRPHSRMGSMATRTLGYISGGGSTANSISGSSLTTPESLKRACKHEPDFPEFSKPNPPPSGRLTLPTSWSTKWHSQKPSTYISPSPKLSSGTSNRENRKKSGHLPSRLDLSVISLHSKSRTGTNSIMASPSKWRIPLPFSTTPFTRRNVDAEESPLRKKRRHSSIGNLDRGQRRVTDIEVEPAFISDARISATPRKSKLSRRCSENARTPSLLWDLSARLF